MRAVLLDTTRGRYCIAGDSAMTYENLTRAKTASFLVSQPASATSGPFEHLFHSLLLIGVKRCLEV